MPRTEPRRTCVVTRHIRQPRDLIRFVLGPDGIVVPDLRRRLPGRGVWVTATRAAVDEAVRKKAFSKGLKTKAEAPADLGARIDGMLAADLRQALALANKAGCVVTGFGKVEAAAGSGVAALVHAAEAAEDGRRKLAAALRRAHGSDAETIPVVTELPGEELDLALGRSHVIHAALVAGAGSDGFLMRWRTLRVYRGAEALPDAPLDEGDGAHDHEPAGT